MLQSQSFEEHNQMLVDNQEEFANVLDALLPEIEKQLMKDIELQLAAQFQQRYQKAIEQINHQALQQFEHAMQQLQESRNILQTQKQSEIQKEIQSLQFALSKLEEQLIVKMQQKFLEEHFDDRIMTHHRIEGLEKLIEEEIYEALEEKHEANKQRQIKELIITHETKEIKIRKQLDQQIKSKIYCSSGLEELKQQIKLSKTQMGSQKSQYNLKLKKIQSQIKDYQDKIKEYEKMPQLQELRSKYEELQVDLIEIQTERQLEKDQKIRQKTAMDEDQDQKENRPHQIDQDSLDQNENQQHFLQNLSQPHQNHSINQRNDSKTLKRQPRSQLINQGAKFSHHQQQPLNEQDLESQSQPQNIANQNSHSRKFNFTAYFKSHLLNSQTAQITQSQNIYIQQNPVQKKSLLNLENVSELLKQKITMDPLEKYLNKQSVSKQNDMNAQNIHQNGQKTSNFAELYEQHLKNLNKGLAKNAAKNTSQSGAQGLSQMAKKTIIKNLSAYHRNNFYSTTDENKSKSVNIANTANEVFRTQESNLLGSYK